MAVPVIIFVVCFGAGVFASSRWLPDLEPGTIGGLSFFVVCGLAGAALGVFGLRIYWLVESLESGFPGRFSQLNRIELASGLVSILWECSLLLGVAAGVYLLARVTGDRRPVTTRPETRQP